MLISRRHKFIFIHIYKNAGSSITAALKPFCINKHEKKVNRILRRYGITYLEPQPYRMHITAEELISEIGEKQFNSYFSFGIVRNPWSWNTSLYTFTLKNKKHHEHEHVKNLGSFENYIHWRCNQSVKLQKDFVYSQDGDLLVDFIGRFETLENDFKKVCDHIGIEARLPKLNISNEKSYREFYTAETADLVRKKFSEDIAMFDYDF